MKDGLDTSVDQKHQRIVGDIHGALAHVDGLGQEGYSCTTAAWLPDWSLVHSEQIVDQ